MENYLLVVVLVVVLVYVVVDKVWYHRGIQLLRQEPGRGIVLSRGLKLPVSFFCLCGFFPTEWADYWVPTIIKELFTRRCQFFDYYGLFCDVPFLFCGTSILVLWNEIEVLSKKIMGSPDLATFFPERLPFWVSIKSRTHRCKNSAVSQARKLRDNLWLVQAKKLSWYNWEINCETQVFSSLVFSLLL